jgi:hypothetical protein
MQQPDIRPHTPQEVRRWAHERRPHEREAPPAAGERLLFRERDFGPAVPAVVTAVQDLITAADHWTQHGGLLRERGPGMPDPTVWAWDEAAARHRLHHDPWPWVHVAVITGAGDDGQELLAPPRWCKEARVRGSAGWLREGSRAHSGDYEAGDLTHGNTSLVGWAGTDRVRCQPVANA